MELSETTIVRNIKVFRAGLTAGTISLADGALLISKDFNNFQDAQNEYYLLIDMLTTMIDIHDDKDND